MIDTVHSDYTEMAASVNRCRDFLGGEFKVKGRGETYLFKLTGQSETEYLAYKERTTFLNATSRTHSGMLGQIFRKKPAINLPPELDGFDKDADLRGLTLYQYCHKVTSEVIAVGRCGTLVDWSDSEGRAAFTFYTREDILNWEFARIGRKVQLSFIALRELEVEQIEATWPASVTGAEFSAKPEITNRVRILFLDQSTGDYGSAIYVEEQKGGGWTLLESAKPTRRGKPLKEIPFYFHDSETLEDRSPRPPLDDLVSLNLNHYRLSADHNHGLRFSALPTPWAAGFKIKGDLTIGSATAWVSDDANAKVGFLEAAGSGLDGLAQKLSKLEDSMAAMGARLLESQKRAAEAAETLSIRQAGETSILASIADGCSESICSALRMALFWTRAEDAEPEKDEVTVALNTDFSTQGLSGADVVAYVSAWLQHAISRETLFDLLKRGEIIPEDRTFEKELEMIEAEMSLGYGTLVGENGQITAGNELPTDSE